MACYADSKFYTKQKVEGTGFGNDNSLHKILLCFAGFLISNAT